MEDPEEILARIRKLAASAKRVSVPKSYRPPVAEDFAPGVQTLNFDQTLSSAGWALLSTEDGKISVRDSVR